MSTKATTAVDASASVVAHLTMRRRGEFGARSSREETVEAVDSRRDPAAAEAASASKDVRGSC